MADGGTADAKGGARPRFIHLRVHSAYSLLEGALQVGKVIDHATADDEPAIAITDTNNLFGALEFAQKASKAGIQPIAGCQLAVSFGDAAGDQPRGRGPAPDLSPIVLIASTEDGYANLVRLVSRAYLETPPGDPVHVETDWLEGLSAGIIALTGGPHGPIGRALSDDHGERARSRLLRLKHLFGDRLYVELQRHGAFDRTLEARQIELAYAHDLPLVATNEAFFRKREDFEAHDALLAIADGSLLSNDDRRRLTPDHYLKTQDEMAALFADLPEALENTVEIAMRCSYFPQTRKPDPAALHGRSGRSAKRRLQPRPRRWRVRRVRGWKSVSGAAALPRVYTEEDYRERLETEIGIITRMKFPGYFLIVSDFIKWAKSEGHSGRAGPRLGCGLAGRLCADHHRHRSVALLASVRALPQSRPRVDARLRHRLLPGPARRGDPLRAGQIRPRPGRPDHHLRNAAGARRAARRGPRARNALRPGRPALASWCRKTRPIR